MALVVNFDIHSNFWKVNPMLRIPEVFAKVYDSDKSEDKEVSSKLMWSVAMYTDTSTENKFKGLSEPERKEIISKDYLKDKKFRWQTVEHLIKEYTRLCLTSAMRQLSLWESKMDEKTEYVSGLTYKDNSEEVEKLLLSNPKLYESLFKIKDALDKETGGGAVRGGSEESATEKGDI